MNKKTINNNVILMIKLLFFLIISVFLINRFGYNSIIPLAILFSSYFAICHHKKILHNLQFIIYNLRSKRIFQSKLLNVNIRHLLPKWEMGRPSLFILSLVLFFSISNLFAGDIYLHMLTTGQPAATKYLGDYLNQGSTWYVAFEVGQTSWNSTEAGIGTSQTDASSGWTWNTAEWYEDGEGSNKKVRTNFGNFQFTSTGTWYFAGRAKAEESDPWHYANDDQWGNSSSLSAAYYFTVNALPTPKSVFAIAESDTIVKLTWSKDATYTTVMVVARANADLSADPTQGTEYSVTDSLGGGTIIYKGTAESFSHESLTSGDSYYYRFYTVNNDYYSPTGTQTKRNVHTTLPNLFENAGVDWSFESDNSSWTSTSTGRSYPYSSDKLYGSNGFSWSSNTTSNSGREATTTDAFFIDPDGTYTLGIYAYNSTVNWEGVRWRIGVGWFDETDAQIGTYSYSSDFSFENRSSWELGEWTGIEPPEGAVSAKFRFQNWRASLNSDRTTFDVAYFVGPRAPASMTSSPSSVVINPNFDQTFTLSLVNEEFDAGLASGHIDLDDDFDGLTIASVTRTNATEATVRLTGNLGDTIGQGIISVLAAGLEGSDSLSTILEVKGNMLSNWHFEDWSAGGSSQPPDSWTWSGAGGNSNRSEDALIGDYSAELTQTTSTNRNFDQFGKTMSEEETYYVEVWVKGQGVVTIGYKNPHTTTYRTAATVTIDTTIEWTKLTFSDVPTGSGDDGGMRIRLKYDDGEGIASGSKLLIGATWLSDTLPPSWWPPIPDEVEAATLNPTTANYDLDTPENIGTTITWNDASSVNDVLDDGTPLTVTDDYEISGDSLIIKSAYLATEIPQAGNAVVLTVDFDDGADATFTVTAIASAPAFSTAATNEAGTVITITFDKDMADPSGKHGQFSFEIDGGGARSFSAAALDAEETKINLTVDGAAIEPGGVVTLSYTPGTVKCSKGESLGAFTDNAVTNNSIRPSIGITKPITSADAYHDTNIKTITISGTVENIEEGDTIEIFSNTTSNEIITLAADSVSWIGSAELTALEDDVWVILTSGGVQYYDTILVNYNVLVGAGVDWRFDETQSKTTWSFSNAMDYPTTTGLTEIYGTAFARWTGFTGSRYFETADSFPVDSTKKYKAGIWLGTSSGANENVRAYIEIYWYDSSGDLIIKSVSPTTEGVTTTGQWDLKEFNNIIPPSNAVTARYRINAGHPTESIIHSFEGAYMYEDGAISDYITFYFKSPSWMTGSPSVWGPFLGGDWLQFVMAESGDWWKVFVPVTNSSAEITYQMRFLNDAGTPELKYQKAFENFGSNPAFTTTTDEIWIDGSENDNYTWSGDNFYLAEDKITEGLPKGIDIISPATSHDTTQKIIRVSGTVENISAGDTIEIFTNSISNEIITLAADSTTWAGTAELTGIDDKVWVKLTSGGIGYYDTITVNYYHISWANLQHPSSGSIRVNNEFNVYARIYIEDKTNGEAEIPEVSAWIGYNTENTDPSGWENWVAADFSARVGAFNDNHEYIADIGSVITSADTYYYASRFKYDEGDTVYGGYNEGFWTGSDSSGVLVITEPLISITAPVSSEESYDTSVKIINVSGTVENISASDTIEIWTNSTSNKIITLAADSTTWSGTAELTGQNDKVVVKLTSNNMEIYDTITVSYCYVNEGFEDAFSDATTDYNGWKFNSIARDVGTKNSGTASAQINAAGDYMITQLLPLPDTLTFYLYATGAASFFVEYSSSTDGPWTQITEITADLGSSFNLQTIDLSDYTNIYLKFKRGGSRTYYIDDVYITVDDRAESFKVAPSTATPTSGKAFNILITETVNADNEIVSGSKNVTVTSDNTDEGTNGVLYNTSATFTAGACTVSVTLTEAGAQELTVEIADITPSETTAVTVQPEPENYVGNWSFEEGTTINADSWTFATGATRNNDSAVIGNWGAKQAALTASYARDITSDTFDIVAENSYYLAGHYYIVDPGSGDLNNYDLYFRIVYEGGGQSEASGFKPTEFDTWVRVDFEMEAPSGVTYANVLITSKYSGTTTNVYWDAIWFSTESPVDAWPPAPEPEPSITITSPAESSGTHDTSYQIITVSGEVEYTSAGDTIEIWTKSGGSDTLNQTIELAADSTTWSGTAELYAMGDSIVVKLTSGDSIAYDTITINYSGDEVIFYFKAPSWMTGTPEVWKSVESVWTGDSMSLADGWWSAAVEVEDANLEITYQIRFEEDGTWKYQKKTGDLGSDPTITTTTSKVWIDGSKDRNYTWSGNDFYLSTDRITTYQPDAINFYFKAPNWMTGTPEIWGPFRSGDWTGDSLAYDSDNHWWGYDVIVPDSSVEDQEYQIRFQDEHGTWKYQKRTDFFDSNAIITTTTGEVWVVGSNSEDYTWDGNNFYLPGIDSNVFTSQPPLIYIYLYLPSWANDESPLISYNVPEKGLYTTDLTFSRSDRNTDWNDQWIYHTLVPSAASDTVNFMFKFSEGGTENQVYKDSGGENWFTKTTTTGEIWIDATTGLEWIEDGPPKKFWLNDVYITEELGNMITNWHFEDWSAGTNDVPPDSFVWSGAVGNISRSTDAFIGHYSTKLIVRTNTNRNFDQFGQVMRNDRNYYVTVWAKGAAIITIGYKNPGTETYRMSSETTLNTDEWTKLSYVETPTNSDTNGGIRISVRYQEDSGIYSDSEVLIGAVWLSDIISEDVWPEIEAPSYQATDFTDSMIYSSQVKLTWTDAERNNNLPAGYLIKWSDVGYGSISNPTNGVAPDDGENQQRVYPGEEEALITGLNPETEYFFKIFSYTVKHNDAKYNTTSAPELSVTTRPSNLLSNWHFEDWTGDGSLATHLDEWEYSGSASHITLSEDALVERYAAQWVPVTSANNLTPLSDINIEGDGTYYAEIWIKPLEVDGSNYVRIGLDIANPTDGSYPGVSYTNYTDPDSGWIKLTQTRSITAGDSGGIRIRSTINQASDAHFIIGAAWFGDTEPPSGWPPRNIINVTPSVVNANEDFAAIFTLDLLEDEYEDPVLVEHITLEEDFSGFDIDNIARVSATKLRIQISGNLSANLGRGKITISEDALTGSIAISALVTVTKLNYIDNWHFDEGWEGTSSSGNPVDWVWGSRGELSDTSLVGNKSFLHEPLSSYNYLKQFGHTMVNQDYYLSIYAKGTGHVRPGIKHSGGSNYGSYVELDDAYWTRIDFEFTSPGDTTDGGVDIGLRRKSATGEALYLGAVWFSNIEAPEGWPFRVNATNAFGIVSTDTSIAEGADTIAVLSVSVMSAANYSPMPNFEITLVPPDTVTVTDTYGNSLGAGPYVQYTNTDGIAKFYMTSSETGSFEVTAQGIYPDFCDTAIVRFSEWTGVEEGWDTIGTIIDGIEVSKDTFVLEPIWSPDGSSIAYLGRYGSDRWDLYKLNATTGDQIKLGDGEKLKINNLSRVSWNYNIGGNSDYVLVTGWELNPSTDKYVSKIFALKTDGSDSNKTISELPDAQQILSGVTGNIHSADAIRNTDTIVLDAGYLNLTVYNKNNGVQISLLDYLNRYQDNGDSHPRYAIGQARWSPCGKHIAFVRLTGPASIRGSWTSMSNSDIFVLFDVDKVLSGEADPVTTVNKGGLGWEDPRLLQLTNNDDNFNWNPNWNRTGDIVNWSSDENNHFDLLNYISTEYRADSTYNEFSGSKFNIYMRKIDDVSKQNVSDVIKVSEGDGNQFSMNYNFDGVAKTTHINISDSKISLKILGMSNKATITETGGILFDNGKTTIVVPAGTTLSQGTEISISEPSFTPDPAEHDGVKIVEDGVAREFFPHGVTFSEPVELILYYTEDQLFEYGIIDNSPQEQLLQIYYYNNDESRWMNYGGVVDPTNGTGYAGKITITTTHFSIYAVGLSVEFNPDSSYLLVESDSMYIEDNDTIPFSIHFKDQYGGGFQGKEAYLKSIPEEGLIIEQSDTKSSSAGIISGYIMAETAGVYILSVVSQNSDTVISDTFELSVFKKADLISSETSYIEILNDTAYADGIESVSINVYILDKNSIGLNNISVKIKIENISDTSDIIYIDGYSDSNGIVNTSITSTVPGYKAISILDLNNQPLLNDTCIIEFAEIVPEVALNYSFIEISNDTALADGSDSILITVNIRNENNEPVLSETVDLIITPEFEMILQFDTVIIINELSDSEGQIKYYLLSEMFGLKTIEVMIDDKFISDSKIVDYYKINSPEINEFYLLSLNNDTALKAKNNIRMFDTAVEITAIISDVSGTEFISVELNISTIRRSDDTIALLHDVFDTNTGKIKWNEVLLADLREGNKYEISLKAFDRYGNYDEKSVELKVTGNFILINTSVDTEIEIKLTDNKGQLIVNTSQLKQLPDGWQYIIKMSNISQSNRAIAYNNSETIINSRNQSIKMIPEMNYGQYEITISKVDADFENEIVLSSGDDFLNNNGYVELLVSYPDNLEDVYARNLRIFYYDDDEGYTEEQQTFIDYTDNKLSAQLTHFSIYFIGMQMVSGFDDLVIYPNPWTPYSIHSVVNFSPVPLSSKIKIFNIAGELVYENNNLGNLGAWTWDMTNTHGSKVASGIYIYMLEYEGKRKIGRISIVK